MVTYGGIYGMGDVLDNATALPDESTRMRNHSSSGSSRRSGVAGYNTFFGDQAVCPTCRGVGHIPHGAILSVF